VLEIKGTVRTGTPRELTLQRMNTEVVLPVTAHGQDFTARVSVSDLPQVFVDPARLDDTRNWKASLDGTPLVVAEHVEPAGQLAGEEEVTAARTTAGYLQISQRTARFHVTSATLREDGVLDLHGGHAVHPDGEIVLRARSRKLSYSFPMTSGGALVPVAMVQTLAGRLPLRQGKWDVLFKATDRALAVTVDDSVTLPSTVEVALRTYSLERQGGRMVLEVGSDLLPEESNAGSKLRQEARAKVKEQGLRDAVLFSCFNGRQYSDSTRAIHEELVRRGSRLEQLWVVGDGQVELPPTAKAVRLNGADYYEAVASSKYIVTNHRIGDWFYRHPDQTVLQTWHGTPLKKIGRDIKEVHFAYAPGMQKAMATSAEPRLPEWTHLVSPNRFSTDILKRAFKFTGEMIEAGYPRNDVLYAPDAAEIAASVRARIGIPAGKKVVLYAPTWRDDQFYGRGRYKADWRIDLDTFEETLGDDHVLLARLHPNVVDGAPEHPLVYDVSSYPDIAELYLVADLMVSDYSSVMFDYANLRRPMLFYTYDLAHYRDKLRGFYFDFETEAPGPLLETSAQLVEAIRDIDKVAVEYESSYDKFYDRFCSLDDGHAAARVVDRVFPQGS
jgi:CDP-glycerol glycerophosphotransferase